MKNKKEKEFGICYICHKKLDKFHLTAGTIKVCSFECADKFTDSLEKKPDEQQTKN